MHTEIAIDGTAFRINGKLTYEGRTHFGKPIEGLLFNSRMVQAIFDDACVNTRSCWVYPDTGVWDPDRNTDEFCAQLPVYRDNGLLAVTVGLQGGGSVYTPEVYDHYVNSAYQPDGTFRPAYFDRLQRILAAADAAGLVVIVNYFYWKQVAHIQSDESLYDITARATEWLLQTGYRNILVDVVNEASSYWNRPALTAENAHRFIDIVKQTTLNGRRLLVSVSTAGGLSLPSEATLAAEDFSLPHGNGCSQYRLRKKLHLLREMDGYRRRPRPVLINEDSINLDNLETAITEYVSWGFYSQGYGSENPDDTIWKEHGREESYDELSGFQTVPVNWSINTPDKRAFFTLLKAITRGA